MAGGVERVVTLKANYFADHLGYDVTIVVTDGDEKSVFFPLSYKVKVVNLEIHFDEMWHHSLMMKIIMYIHKQRLYKKRLADVLDIIKPDFTISTLRREINFISSLNDGSKKIGEIHINRAHYRNFSPNRSNPVKSIFAKFWMHGLVNKLKRLDRFVVLTKYDRQAWQEIPHVDVIPNPLPFYPKIIKSPRRKRVIAVGRYFDEKGYDMLLEVWSIIEKSCADWELDIFGDGNKPYYEGIAHSLNIDKKRCHLNDSISDIQKEYLESSLFVCTSRFEGFGMGIIEAMACGLPVVSFDCLWGPRSIITSGEDGILVENGDIKKMADAMVALINSPDSLSKMGQKARENVRRFDIEIVADKWKVLFDNLAECVIR
jgi:glycosyltransferase involved in cell wall biosynthesis